jgi:4-hydroxy-tetrahydrodipicolinate synthase
MGRINMKKRLTKKDLNGIFPALVTPTYEDGKGNQKVTKDLLHYLMKAGVAGIVPLGGTGEFTNLPPIERVRFIEFVVNEVNGRLPVIAGVLAPGYYESIEIAKDFIKAGVDGIMLLTPFYVKPTQDGIIKYFLSFIEKVKIPVILYDIPYRTMVSVEPATVRKIVEQNELLIGMKACNPDLAHFTRLMLQVGDLISVLSGEEYLFMSHVLLGAKGGVLATCNLYPDAWIKMYNYLKKGDIESAKNIMFALVPILDAAFSEINPGPLKAGLEMFGFQVGKPLLPLLEPQTITLEKLKASMNSFKEHSSL